MDFKKLFCGLLVFSFLFSYFSLMCLALDQELEIGAPAYVLIEKNSGKVICEKNKNEVRFAASVMKTMLILMAVEALDSGRMSEEDVVVISSKAANIGGANVWLKEGENIKVKDLIRAIAMVSANDACIALAEFMGGSEGEFIAMMNERAKEIGLENTIFKDCVGSDEDGNVTSAYDIAVLSKEIMEHKSALPYISTWIGHIRDGQTQIVNTNKILKIYQGAIGIKTGTSEKAGSCICACAERSGMTLIAVILGGENSKDRFSDTSKLLDYGFSNYTLFEPKVPSDFTGKVSVFGGMKREIDVAVQTDGGLVIKKGEENSVVSEINMQENLNAPVNSGEKVGTLVYKNKDETLAEYDILASSSVEEIKFSLVLKKLISKFFSL